MSERKHSSLWVCSFTLPNWDKKVLRRYCRSFFDQPYTWHSSSSTFFAALSLVLVSMACSCWKCVLQLLVSVMFFPETMGGVGFGTLSFGLILGTITAFIYLRKTGRLLVQASTDHWLPMTSAEVTCWRPYVPGTYPGQDILTERWINENWADCL